jgi:nickel/cobalt exporter
MKHLSLRSTRHIGSVAAALTLGLAASLAAAHAQGTAAGPFGVGAPEIGAQTSTIGIFGWIAVEQAAFLRTLTSSLKAFRTDPHAGLILIGISAIYGVFHAAGPGHGKAVIASYLIANKQTLRRGIVLSFISAFFQGLVAVTFVSIARFIFDVTAVQMTAATEALELASALLVTGLGLWLVATKVFRIKFWRSKNEDDATAGGFSATRGSADHVHSANCGHTLFAGLGAPKLAGATAGGAAAFSSSGSMVCADCGSTHMPDPAMLVGPMNWKKAIGAIIAVGVRPCSGAIIILVFAFSMRMYAAGVLSVAAMSLGTGVTVSALAGFAVFMKDRAVGLAGRDSALSSMLVRAAEILAALGVLAMGSLLLGATLTGLPIMGT